MILKGLSLLFLGVGVFVLVQLLMPIIAFKAWEFTTYDQSQVLVNPDPTKTVSVDQQVLGVSIETVDNFPALVSKNSRDLPYQEFLITVPKINLKNIKVEVNSNSFETNLAQLPGTALPGERGNVFISGHSSLPNNLISAGRKAFFVNLPSLKIGDEILVDAVGQRYRYVVSGMKIVSPSDIGVINPPDNQGRYLTLMTCVPPGFNTKRLVVLAHLKQS